MPTLISSRNCAFMREAAHFLLLVTCTAVISTGAFASSSQQTKLHNENGNSLSWLATTASLSPQQELPDHIQNAKTATSKTSPKTVSNGLTFNGTTGYSCPANSATCTLTASSIQNSSTTRTTGRLRLELWATTSRPSRGGALSGNRITVTSSLGQLAPSRSFVNVSFSGSRQDPASGTYWITLVLMEFGTPNNSSWACPAADGFCITDSVTFDTQQTYGGGGGGGGGGDGGATVLPVLTGTVGYECANGICSMTAGRIENNSQTRTSGTLRLELWLSTVRPTGSSFTGFKVASGRTLNPLPPRNFYSNLDERGAFTAPPNGTYFVTLLLTEFSSSCGVNNGYCTVDQFVFDRTWTIGSANPPPPPPPPPPTNTDPNNYSDLWWNSTESGWGVSITHRLSSGIAFIAWYTYDSVGNPKWYVASSCPMLNGRCRGILYETTGPSFLGIFNPNQINVRTVGSIQFAFSNNSSGTMSYSVNGVAGVKSIQRQPF